MLHWFKDGNFPLYLAPMAGVTDRVFRSICKHLGADVMVTEFVSSEGIIRRDDRTRKYTEFDDQQRPVGVQLFGCLLYTSPSPRDRTRSRMPSSA